MSSGPATTPCTRTLRLAPWNSGDRPVIDLGVVVSEQVEGLGFPFVGSFEANHSGGPLR